MSAARPITRAINELKAFAEEVRVSHTIDDKWPESEMETYLYYVQLRSTIKNAETEFSDLRQKELRLSRYESQESAA